MQLDPGRLSRQENSRLLYRMVVPRPIAWVSTVNEDRTLNLAPFSYFTVVSVKPPAICLAISWPEGQKKGTLANIEAGREFVVNMVTEELAQPMSQTAFDYGPGVSKFAVASVTPVPGTAVNVPRVAESPLSMECRLAQIVELGETDSRFSLVIGEVVQFYVRDDLYRDGDIDIAHLGAVGQLARDTYCLITSTFEAKRP